MNLMMTLNTYHLASLKRFLVGSALLLSSAFAQSASLDILNRVETKIEKVSSRIEAVNKDVEKLAERIPDSPEMKAIAAEIAVEKISLLLDLYFLGVSGEEILEVMRQSRDGYQSWLDVGGPGNMRGDLKGVLDNLQVLGNKTQKLRCYQNPNANLLAIQTNSMRDQVDLIPKLLLFAIKNLLVEVMGSDWRQTFVDLASTLPNEYVQNVCSQVETTLEVAKVAQCEALTTLPWQLKNQLRRANANATHAKRLATAIAEIESESIVVGAAANVEVGAGATVQAPNPAKPILDLMKEVLDNYAGWTKHLMETQNACLAQELKIEADLLSCSLRREYIGSTPLAAQSFYARTLVDPSGYDMNFRQLCTNYQVQICDLYQRKHPEQACYFRGWSGPDA